jgi:AcrR family transcriptional regulator
MAEDTTRDLILDAADRLFGEAGFDAATTREISEISGVNKALIHYHFGSKEELLASVLDRYYERLTLAMGAAFQGEWGLRERLILLIDTYVDFLNRNRSFCRIVQREASGGKHLERIRAHMVPLFGLGVSLVDGAFPGPRPPELAAHHLLLSFYGMIVTYFTYSDVLSHLINDDPFSAARLDERKRHLHLMLDALLTVVAPVK